jgi:hypothetical protein
MPRLGRVPAEGLLAAAGRGARALALFGVQEGVVAVLRRGGRRVGVVRVGVERGRGQREHVGARAAETAAEVVVDRTAAAATAAAAAAASAAARAVATAVAAATGRAAATAERVAVSAAAARVGFVGAAEDRGLEAGVDTRAALGLASRKSARNGGQFIFLREE